MNLTLKGNYLGEIAGAEKSGLAVLCLKFKSGIVITFNVTTRRCLRSSLTAKCMKEMISFATWRLLYPRICTAVGIAFQLVPGLKVPGLAMMTARGDLEKHWMASQPFHRRRGQ